jgi:hypothetical protein
MNSTLRDLKTLAIQQWGEEAPAELDVRLSQLQAWHDGKRPLSDADLAYWSDRFRAREVRELASASFERYLMRPLYYERIARARRIVKQRLKALRVNRLTDPYENDE